MAHTSCSISGFFEPSRSINSVFAPTGFKQEDMDIFGNRTLTSFSASFTNLISHKTVFASEISQSGVFKYQESLTAEFSCSPGVVSTGVAENCGSLIFSQVCSSAHIVTIGL